MAIKKSDQKLYSNKWTTEDERIRAIAENENRIRAIVRQELEAQGVTTSNVYKIGKQAAKVVVVGELARRDAQTRLQLAELELKRAQRNLDSCA